MITRVLSAGTGATRSLVAIQKKKDAGFFLPDALCWYVSLCAHWPRMDDIPITEPVPIKSGGITMNGLPMLLKLYCIELPENLVKMQILNQEFWSGAKILHF